MDSQSTNVFVSYSHADASLVDPVVKLLRVNKSLVFQDTDGIAPGKKWRGEIAKALNDCHLVVLFWCDHACQSQEVSKEWKSAVDQEKDILPLLLDATPLPPELCEFQWIDFRNTVGQNHSLITSPSSRTETEVLLQPGAAPKKTVPGPSRAAPKSFRSILTAVFAVFVVLSGVLLYLSLESGLKPTVHPNASVKPIPVPPPPIPVPSPPSPIPVPPPPTGILADNTSFLLGAIIVLIIFLVWIRQRSKSLKSPEIPESFPDGIEQLMAKELEMEILRRTSFRIEKGR